MYGIRRENARLFPRLVLLSPHKNNPVAFRFDMRNVCSSIIKLACLSTISLLIFTTSQPPNRAQNKLISLEEPTQPLSKGYTQDQIDYFIEVALGSEFGDATSTIKKWNGDVRIKVFGSPTQEDLKTLRSVINEINTITKEVRLKLDNNNPHVKLYFVPESKFRQYEKNYRPTNLGFFWNSWNAKNVIYSSNILISTNQVTQTERSHLIREELTQSLGLMKDSYRYKDSIFYQGWTSTTKYSEIDKALIEILYRPEIRPGMTKAQVLQVFKTLNTNKEPTSTSTCEPSDTNPALDFSVTPFCETR
jgi:hypothetical protein